MKSFWFVYVLIGVSFLSCNNDSKLNLFSAEKVDKELITNLTVNPTSKTVKEQLLPSIYRSDSVNAFYLQADSIGVHTLDWKTVDGVEYSPKPGTQFDFNKNPSYTVTITYTQSKREVKYLLIGQRKAITDIESRPVAFAKLSGDAIVMMQQEGVDLSKVRLDFNLPYRAVSIPKSGTIFNLMDNEKDTITVTFLDKTKREYVISTAKEAGAGAKEISGLKTNLNIGVSKEGQRIRLLNQKIKNLEDVKLSWDMPKGAVSVPLSGSSFNLDDANKDSIVVTFGDKSRQIYFIEKYFKHMEGKELLRIRFEIDRVAYYGKLGGDTWTVEVPASTDLTKLPTPDLQVSEKATHDKPNQTDFSTEVTYTITAEDGSTKRYKVNVVKEREFVTKWNMNGAKTLALPIYDGGTYNFAVDWGDGTPKQQVTSWNDADATHTYATNGTYTVTITGTIDGFSFTKVGTNASSLVNILSWGSLKLGNEGGYFANTSSLSDVTPSDVLDLSGTTNLSSMFSRSTIRTLTKIDKWDVSEVTNMESMFLFARQFNHTINDWNVSNVITMKSMFLFASAFDQPLDKWNVSKVTDMSDMFSYAQEFNHSLNDWNVANVTNMSGMFVSAKKFNQPLNDWNVSKVTSMSAMFARATAFNQPLDGWDVSNNVYFQSMFSDATSFNQPLNNWVTKTAKGMDRMFSNATSFNQPLNNWDVSKVPIFSQMFMGATAFNQPLDKWDVSKATDMPAMFKNATAYTQKLCSWKISSGTDIKEFSIGAGVNPLDCPKPFVTKWNMSGAKNLVLPIYDGGTYNFEVDWGDGTAKQQVTSWNDADATHTYATNGTYTVTITGTIDGFSFTKVGANASNLVNILSWGSLKLGNEGGYFANTSSLSDVTPSDILDLSGTTNLSSMFNSSTIRTLTNIDKWDVSKVTNMGSLFRSAVNINQSVDKWNVSNVDDLSYMFFGASSFTQTMCSWKVKSGANLSNFGINPIAGCSKS